MQVLTDLIEGLCFSLTTRLPYEYSSFLINHPKIIQTYYKRVMKKDPIYLLLRDEETTTKNRRENLYLSDIYLIYQTSYEERRIKITKHLELIERKFILLSESKLIDEINLGVNLSPKKAILSLDNSLNANFNIPKRHF